MTKAELVEAAMKMDVTPGAADKLRAQQREDVSHADREQALSEWCPPSRARGPKKRVWPRLRAACGLLMDGDRLAEHFSQCSGCQAAGARLQVSNDGVNWTNYTGPLDRIDRYLHVRTGWIKPATSEPGRAGWCNNCGCGNDGLGYAHLESCEHAAKPAQEAAKADSAAKPLTSVSMAPTLEGAKMMAKHFWMASQSGKPYTGPERLPRDRPPLAHSYGIEDPALPDA